MNPRAPNAPKRDWAAPAVERLDTPTATESGTHPTITESATKSGAAGSLAS